MRANAKYAYASHALAAVDAKPGIGRREALQAARRALALTLSRESPTALEFAKSPGGTWGRVPAWTWLGPGRACKDRRHVRKRGPTSSAPAERSPGSSRRRPVEDAAPGAVGPSPAFPVRPLPLRRFPLRPFPLGRVMCRSAKDARAPIENEHRTSTRISTHALRRMHARTHARTHAQSMRPTRMHGHDSFMPARVHGMHACLPRRLRSPSSASSRRARLGCRSAGARTCRPVPSPSSWPAAHMRARPHRRRDSPTSAPGLAHIGAGTQPTSAPGLAHIGAGNQPTSALGLGRFSGAPPPRIAGASRERAAGWPSCSEASCARWSASGLATCAGCPVTASGVWQRVATCRR